MKKLTQNKLLQDVTFLSASLLISKLLFSIRGIIIPKFLGPVDYGIYNGLLVFPEYLLHFHFGSLSALKREIPFCYGKNDLQKAQRIRNIVFSQYMGTIIVSIGMIGFSTFLFQDRFSHTMIVSLRWVCLLIFIQALVDVFLENVLRTDNQFSVLSNSEIFKSVAGFGFMLVLIWHWHLYGLIISLILSSLLKGLYIYYRIRYHFKWIWDFNELCRLLKIGFPILFGLILITIFGSVDRIMILNYLEAKQLGYYALGLTVLKFLLIIQSGAYGVLEPRVYRLYGKTKKICDLKELIWNPIHGMCMVFPFIIGMAYICIPYLVSLILPKYLPSMTCIRIMVLGSFFFIFIEGTYTFIVTINRQILIVWVIGVGILVSLLLMYILLKLGWGIEGVALGTIGSNILVGGIFLIYTLNHFFKGRWKKISALVQIFLPVSLVIGLLMGMDQLWPNQGHWKADLDFVLIKIGCLLLLIGPFLWKVKKKFGMLRMENNV